MNELLKLPFEIQIVLVAGYLGYKLTTATKKVEHKTEDFLLQVLVFGTLGRVFSYVVARLVMKLGYWAPTTVVESDYKSVAIISVLAIIGSVGFALLWRKYLEKWVKAAMSKLKIYHDDHETSAFRSVMSADTRWSFVQVHLANGKIVESLLALPEQAGIPTKPIILNDDGIAMYVTAVYEGDERREFDQVNAAGDTTITYIPRSEIKQIDVGWRK
ncbi:hypothetical protein ABID08_002342 [Rhizobium binae]|uniref:Uncharacterized protein n=1 Tax=Rhizobium binae TaxID=1138190 RepID=A0ABV2MEV0_9HYPH|nr:hypothetical protein [Rhizobium binae]MBX4993158.1 hypothetical protein [Rhizobium binae]NKL47461.1 hypothetical protein [Rhizobium leguminosarum bv. viciae]QSY83920.1 hypothetical protein J2J99_09055 [Rhizobium binae]